MKCLFSGVGDTVVRYLVLAVFLSFFLISLQSIEADEFGTLVSEDSLPTSPSDQVSVEVIQEKYSKLETEKEILVVDLEKIKIESEQKQQQYQKMEDDYNNLVKKLADMEQTQASEEAGKDLELITELSQQLEIQTGVLTRLKEELESEKLENERYKRKIGELEQTKVGITADFNCL